MCKQTLTELIRLTFKFLLMETMLSLYRRARKSPCSSSGFIASARTRTCKRRCGWWRRSGRNASKTGGFTELVFGDDLWVVMDLLHVPLNIVLKYIIMEKKQWRRSTESRFFVRCVFGISWTSFQNIGCWKYSVQLVQPCIGCLFQSLIFYAGKQK